MRAALPSPFHSPCVPAGDGVSRSARLARAVRRLGGGRGRETRAPAVFHSERGEYRGGGAGGGVVLAAGTMSADEEELKVPEDMFKDVKFFVVGDIDPKVPGHPPLCPFPQLLPASPPASGGEHCGIFQLLFSPPVPPHPQRHFPRRFEAHAPIRSTRPGKARGRGSARAEGVVLLLLFCCCGGCCCCGGVTAARAASAATRHGNEPAAPPRRPRRRLSGGGAGQGTSCHSPGRAGSRTPRGAAALPAAPAAGRSAGPRSAPPPALGVPLCQSRPLPGFRTGTGRSGRGEVSRMRAWPALHSPGSPWLWYPPRDRSDPLCVMCWRCHLRMLPARIQRRQRAEVADS